MAVGENVAPETDATDASRVSAVSSPAASYKADKPAEQIAAPSVEEEKKDGRERRLSEVDLRDSPRGAADDHEIEARERELVKSTLLGDLNERRKSLVVSPEGKNSDIKRSNGLNKDEAKGKRKKLETSLHEAGKKGLFRHIIAILALSSILLANMNRQAFNQALVSMTKTSQSTTPEPVKEACTEVYEQNSTLTEATSSETTLLPSTETATIASVTENQTETITARGEEAEVEAEFDDRFDWTGSQIGALQSAFSYGYTPFMIPGGRMSELYGAKWVVFLSGFGSALCCVLTPYFADTNYHLLVASRVFMGLCQTGVSPALYALLTRWLPANESSVYLPMIKVGVMAGFMSGSLVSGFFTWRMTFYITGLIGIMWSVMWIFMVTSDPREHKILSKPELEYILFELKKASISSKPSLCETDDVNVVQTRQKNKKKQKSAPWFKIMTNPVILAFIFAKFTVKLSTDAQSMQIPMYLRNVFKVPQELNGILSGTNFAIQGLFTGLVAYAAKEFVVRETFGMNKTGVRRLFQGINHYGMAFAYILMTFNMSSLSIVCCAVILLSITSMFGAGGEAVTPVDLSTEYSASIMAIANSFANLSGIVLPPLISMMLDDQLDSAENWNSAWRLLGAIVIVGGLVFSFLVTAELQGFEKDDRKKNTSNSEVCIEMKAN